MGEKAVEKMGSQAAKVSQIAMASLALMFGTEQFDENLGLAAGQFIYRIAVGREIDEADLVSVMGILDARSTHCSQGSGQGSRPPRGLLRLCQE